jgi:hypothetical protein
VKGSIARPWSSRVPEVCPRVCAFLALFFFLPVASYTQVKGLAEKLGYPADAKLLIILADDVGIYHSANQASFTALNQRAVTSGTVIQTSPWLTEVAAYAKQHPEISLGVHLALSSEYTTYRWGPVASKDQVPSLLDPTGYLFAHGSDTVTHAKPAEIDRELRAQVDRALQFGLNLAHDYKLPFVIGRDRATGGKFVPLVSDRDVVLESVIVIPSTTPIEDWTGFYTRAVETLTPGLHQLYVHHCFDDAEAEAISVDHTAYGAAWRQRDFNVMTSPEFKQALADNHVVLVSWKDVKKIM